MRYFVLPAVAVSLFDKPKLLRRPIELTPSFDTDVREVNESHLSCLTWWWGEGLRHPSSGTSRQARRIIKGREKEWRPTSTGKYWCIITVTISQPTPDGPTCLRKDIPRSVIPDEYWLSWTMILGQSLTDELESPWGGFKIKVTFFLSLKVFC